MPVTKSAKKALRQNKKRWLRNLQYKKRIKALLKELRILFQEKKVEEAQKLLPQFYKAIDKAAKVGVLKKRTAARKKSKMAKKIQELLQVSKTNNSNPSSGSI